MRRLFKELPLLLRPALSRSNEERYLVVQLRPDGATAHLFRLDTERVLRLVRAWPDFKWEMFAHERLPGRFLPNVILSAHPSLAGSVTIPVRIDRPAGAAPLTQDEFESHLRQMHVKLWNEHRAAAAEALGVPPVDAVLVDLRITDLKVDGRDVLHPRELAGNRLDMCFTVAFTTREVFETWQKLFSTAKGFFFTDAGRAALDSLSALEDAPATVLMAEEGGLGWLRPAATKTFTRLEYEKLDWDVAGFPQVLERAWGLSPQAARDVHAAYCAGRTSEHAAGTMRELYAPHIAAFEKALKTTKAKGRLALLSALPFPAELLGKRTGTEIVLFPTDALLDRFHFSIAPHALLPYGRAFVVAPLIEFYYHNRHAEVNQWLKRRVHWLITARR